MKWTTTRAGDFIERRGIALFVVAWAAYALAASQ